MARKTKTGNTGAPAWMATFADMTSLLLTFFVLLLSFATMDIMKFKDAMGSINEALGSSQTRTVVFGEGSGSSLIEIPMSESESKKIHYAIKEDLEKLIEKKGLQEDINVVHTKRGLILRVRGKMFFNSGGADLKYASIPVLEKIAEILKNFPNRVSIEGHTDTIPIRGGTFTSNWELSTARAYSALKYFQGIKGIDVTNIYIGGFGDTHPISPNDTPEGRAQNRRVEFVFHE